jgi:phosphohistidine phosphatase
MSERTLILFRHSKSDQSSSEADIDRPLNNRGRTQAPEAGRWLADNAGEIDLAVVSPAHRARTTWELASAELTGQPRTRIDDRVYNASVSDLLDVVRDLPDDVRIVVLVGHNPGFEDLASFLTNEPVSMPTSALAVLEPDAAWSSAGEAWASLRASGRPPD